MNMRSGNSGDKSANETGNSEYLKTRTHHQKFSYKTITGRMEFINYDQEVNDYTVTVRLLTEQHQ